MNKNIFILLVLFIVLLLSSCSFRGMRKVIVDDSDKKADARLEQILNALSDNDKDALKAMFSKQALSEANDFDENINYLFDFFKGTIKSWERTGFTAPMRTTRGKKAIELISWYTVTTDKDSFSFFVIDYSIDTFNSDNVGLYALRVIKTADEDAEFTYWQDMEIPGIYNPGE